MKKNITLVDFSDILSYAEKLGFFWNQTQKIMENDRIVPFYEESTRDFYFSDCVNAQNAEHNPYGWSNETLKILVSFMVKENLDKFCMTM